MKEKVVLLLALVVLLVAGMIAFRLGGSVPSGPIARAAQVDSSFTSPVNISKSYDYNGSQHPRLAIAPDTYLHVTWMEGLLDPDRGFGPTHLRGREGEWPAWEWAGPHDNPGYTKPAIALGSDGTVHLVWAGGGGPPYDIYYAYKPVGGSWSTPVNISNMAGNTVYPTIALDSQGTIWVAWQTSLSETDTAIYARAKPASGDWGTIYLVSPSNKNDQNPSLAIGKGDVPHLVWRNDDYSPNWEILYSKFEGGSWTSPLNLSSNSTDSYFPRIAADSAGNVFVVWEDNIDGGEVFQTVFRRWDGSQWLPYKRVSYSPVKALWPALHADGCNLYAVWTDFRDGQTETYFSHSTDCGSTWLGDENVSRNSSASYYPDVVAQPGGYSHIVWEDMAPGQLDILYSKATVAIPTPTPTPPTPTSTSTPTPTPTSTPTPTPTPTSTPT
ncbi:MAG: hypothetical protein ACP5OO_05270, partial [Chloroflexia bacterium]